MLSDQVALILGAALARILGKPKAGSMAFVRCLPPDTTAELAAHEGFSVRGWRIAAVVESTNPQSRAITADQAVEWRESKGEATLLLVDPGRAGAGMDGIYGATREIGEAEVFKVALDLAHKDLPLGFRGFAKKALSKAGWGVRRRPVAPWAALTYLCQGHEDPSQLGSALPLIGLWPIALYGTPHEADLDKSLRLVERLIPTQGSSLSPEQRAAALKLGDSNAAQQVKLASVLREIGSMPRQVALTRMGQEPDLWLNHMDPGMFDEQTLNAIEWLDWRGKTKKPGAWSGLRETDDGRLELRLSSNADDRTTRARLEVRWKTDPDTLTKGVVEYLVQVTSGQDVLAEKTVSHTGKSPQKAVFVQDDFDDLEEDARFEALVTIRALGGSACEAESEDFVLCFGDTETATKSSAGKVRPTLALAVTHLAADGEVFKELARNPANRSVFSTDKKGFITCRLDGKVARVFCPPLIAELGRDWVNREGALGRWRLAVRSDGTRVGEAGFVPVASEFGAERLAQQSRQLANWMAGSQGPLGILYHHEIDALNKYVLAASDAWQQGAPALTLINTLEVVSLAGRTLGIVVLPIHPLRVAWQQSFDLLVAHHRYEEGLSAAKIEGLLERITGAHYPSFLPGTAPGEAFVFADTLGFHAVALVRTDDPEPKATVALLGRLMGGDESAAPSVGKGSAEALAGELRRYLQLHPHYRRVRVHALRAGDAMPVACALGHALKAETEGEDGPDDGDNQLCYELDLFPGAEQASTQTGRFLSATAERRRSGAGAVPEGNRWLLESVTRPGGVTLPRLRWARRADTRPSTPAHVAIAFDAFASRVECRKQADLPADGVLEAHGLMLMPSREFHAAPTPHWLSFIPPTPEGEKHPVTGILTKRQVSLHAQILRAMARHLSGRADDWPVLVTEVTADQADLLQDLHRLCDWVVTADRNAGIEYFDSPRELPRVYENYIIDCVPERDDLGFMQLITSTSSFDEVVSLLDGALGEMGLSASPRNCTYLLEALKAVSGRLALRLAGAGNAVQEMIAVALAQQHCARAIGDDAVWLSLVDGFLIPLDDVPQLFREPGKLLEGGEQRADLLYMTATKKSGLRLSFVEVKFRRYLKTARSPDLAEGMERQIAASCQRWGQLFGTRTSALEKTVNRAWLARILRFYARKGRRHGLSQEAFNTILREIDRVVRREADPPDGSDIQRVGFVFCPEYGGRQPVPIEHGGEAYLWLFGPDILPEPQAVARDDGEGPGGPGGERPETAPRAGDSNPLVTPLHGVTDPLEVRAAVPDHDPPPTEHDHSAQSASNRRDTAERCHESQMPVADDALSRLATAGEATVLLGHRESDDEPVIWRANIRANPHLMILGQPGMGKTTSLINICLQLEAQGVTPIVFSYHEDIDEKLGSVLAEPPLIVRYAGLGFNPMEVIGDNPLAYLDNVGMLRDIFSAIFRDLGDVQLGRLREALKQSYLERGWSPTQSGGVPAFRTFLDRLRAEEKPDKGLLTRLNELDDYGLFDADRGAPTLLDQGRLSLIAIHGTQNENLQRAFATFVLYNLYQGMFRRGTQGRITHAVIFDEAHRAARLKLIPSMIKECRKYGIAFVIASQEAKDFDPSLFTAVANYLALRLNEPDAKLMAKSFAAADKVGLYTDRIKQMPKYQAMYYGEGLRAPIRVALEQYQPRDHPPSPGPTA
jgi:DNA phosphorothioation-dependent restriction protein DptH